ncbi:hypothetical protein GF362_06320 [Candidatus Dojkabacteria bacterium]|nr:hypothetical protein [Candidatus Dojkabacteria bacterium]
MLYLPSLYRDIFIDKFSLDGWRFSHVQYFFPDMFLYFLILIFSGNLIISTFLFGIFQALVLVFSSICLIRTVCGDTNPQVTVIVTLVYTSIFSIGSIAGGNLFELLHYVFKHSFHIGTFLCCIWGVIFTMQFLQTKNKKYLIYILTISILAGISDKLFVVMFIVPLFTTIMILRILRVLSQKTVSKLGDRITIASIIIIIFSLLIKINNFVESPDLSSKLDNFGKYILILVRSINNFGSDIGSNPNAYLILFFYFSIIFSSIYFIKYFLDRFRNTQIKNRELNILFFSLFSLFSSSFMLLSPLFLGLYLNIHAVRYFIGIVVLSLNLLILASIYNLRKNQIVINQKIYKYFIISVTLIAGIGLFATGKLNKVKAFISYYPSLSQCLDKYSNDYELTFGLSNYWNSSVVTNFSKKNIIVNQLNPDLSIYHWLNNKHWYCGEEKASYINPKYTFIITEGLERNRILQQFGSPRKILMCEETEIFIYKKNLLRC